MRLKIPTVTKGLHWTTVASEKLLLALIGIATCIAAAYVMSLKDKISLGKKEQFQEKTGAEDQSIVINVPLTDEKKTGL